MEKEETPAAAFGGWKKARRRRVEPAGGACCGARPRRPVPSRRRRRRARGAPRGGAAKARGAGRTRPAARRRPTRRRPSLEGGRRRGGVRRTVLGAAAARRLVADGFERPAARRARWARRWQPARRRATPCSAAPTGSGKTLAYLLRTLADADGPGGVLVVAPGRELAVQIDRVARRHFVRRPRLRSSAARTGSGRREALRKAKPALVVGTPGRLAELAFEGSRPPEAVGKLRWCVVDECDHALRPPFGEDVEALLGALPRSCGVVFASATGAALLGDEGEAARRARAALRVDATAAGRAGVASGALAAKARHGRPSARRRRSTRTLRRRCGPRPRPARRRSSSSRTRRPPAVATRLAAAGLDARALVGDAHSTARAAAVRHLNEGAAPAVVVATDGAARGAGLTPRVTHVVAT